MESLRFSRSIYLKNVEVHSEAEENSTDPVKKKREFASSHKQVMN